MMTTPNRQEDNALSQLLAQRITVNWEFALYLVIFMLAVFSRFYMLEDRVMSHDESLHTRFSYDLYRDGNFQHTPLMHGPVLFHATAFSYFLFGDSDFSSRIYPALLGVLMVMFPLLLRKWLGRWGALIASFLLLISPLLLYYNRYIRHDTPSIFYGMVMAYCILMYLNGSPRFRRRAYWLYLFAAAMVLNLGSKETAFIYIAIFGSFLCIYFAVRLLQQRYDWSGRPLLQGVLLGILLGGMMMLGMYIIVDIIPAQILPGRGVPWGSLSDLQRSSWLSWTLLTLCSGLFVLLSTALYAFRGRLRLLPRRELLLIFLLALITWGALLFIEELSHFPEPAESAESAEPVAAAVSWLPVHALWLVMFAGLGFLIYNARRAKRQREKFAIEKSQDSGLWGYLYAFPEVDFIVLIGTLILPWMTAVFPRLMRVGSSDYAGIAESLPDALYQLLLGLPNIGSSTHVGQFAVGAAAFIPLFVLMAAIGLSWNWKRWLIAALIFHVIFAFFFTTVFTNIAGLASGMIYSLGYWLEQQGVRRGSQPQYYYLLIIMPTYEFLPILGSAAAMFAGVTGYWKMRRQRLIQIDEQAQLEAQAEIDEQAQLEAQAEIDEQAQPAAQSDPPLMPEQPPPAQAPADSAGRLQRLPFLLLLAWWAILNLVGYSLAGEKMPWLGTHLTVPLILLAAGYFGGILARLDKAMFLSRGWLALLLMPLFIVSGAQVIGAPLAGSPPFAGLSQPQLERTYGWLAALAVTGGLGYALVRIAQPIKWIHLRRLFALTLFGLLSLITMRAAWLASFVNYDLPTEFLVYAHAAPGIKWVLDDIDEMSLRMTDGNMLKFAYDNEVSWPYSWYFRDYPNALFIGENPTVQSLNDAIFVVVGSGNRGKVEPIVEDRYLRRDYMRMWWPMQEYFGLTPDRLLNVLDLSPDNHNAAAIRRGIFDIWWKRDYEEYGAAINRDFSLTNWPVSDRMHVYIRKDFAAKIWEYGIGTGEVASDIPTEVNPCSANWQQIAPLAAIESLEQRLNYPLGLTVGGGKIYVAEEYASRVSAFSTDGSYLRSYDHYTSDRLGFNRPNSVAMMPNGDMLVVDTWNYRLQRIDPKGNLIAEWGQAGEFGFDAPGDPWDGFWGPRDVVVGADGRIYVADTGNKRIRVYALEEGSAVHLFDVGRGGSAAGELDEPSGLAIHSDGRLFIADTWNRRIAIFDGDGQHLSDFRVRGWYNSTINRPYLALDEARSLLYISDPDSSRVLVYDLSGECIGSFGREGSDGAGGQFEGIGGIAADENGFIYISDSVAGKIYRFAPFPLPLAAEQPAAESENEGEVEEIVIEQPRG